MRVLCQCGNKFFVKKSSSKYCSKVCFYKYRKRPKGLSYKIKVENKAWFKKGYLPYNLGDGNGWIDEGYRKISINGKTVREHRYLIEKILGRKLSNKEVVHHRDKNKLNNSLENLEVMDISDHISMHHKKVCVF